MKKPPIRFVNKDKNAFFDVLKERVDEYFENKKISRNSNSTMIVKTFVLLSGYFLPFAALLLTNPTFGVALTLWIIMGFAFAGVGMSVMHDANHGAYSEKNSVNNFVSYSLNFIGGSIVNWKLQHNILHHTYTNIAEMDDDIDDKLVFRFSPHSPAKWYHKFQPIYAFLFYGITTLYWALLKDFVQYNRYIKEKVNRGSSKENAITFVKILISKVVYFYVFLVMPTMVFGLAFNEVLIGFLIMHFIGGVVLTVIFQLAHTVEGTSHPIPDEKGIIENAWAIHQMNTTVDFARHNKLLSWYIGGLNFQVEHHLFPKICHVHYPEIAPIVKKTAEEYGVPYLENETFWSAFRSHIAALKRFGTMPKLNDAIG